MHIWGRLGRILKAIGLSTQDSSSEFDQGEENVLLIAGLGNPGSQYANNRHNIGFMVVAELANRMGISLSPSRFEAKVALGSLSGSRVLLAQPMTFMNRSGGPVSSILRFYKEEPKTNLLVVHDELDLEFGVVRIKDGGGTAGHNGLKSIASATGTKDFLRIRFGIGRPEKNGQVTSHVLSDFSAEESCALSSAIDLAADAAEAVVAEGALAAMNKIHSKQ